MTDIVWTTEAVIDLLHEFRIRPELYDQKHPLYRNAVMKKESWRSLAQLFDCDVTDMRKKLNSCFASYRREKTKVGGGGHTKWFLYEHMSFWPNHIENNQLAVTKRTNYRKETTKLDITETAQTDLKDAIKVLGDISKKMDGANTDRQTDEFDDFGTYVASVLRSLPTDRALILQPQIISLINSTETFLDGYTKVYS